MFADSLLETSWAQRGQRSWTTLTSFGLQAVAIAILLAVPLLTTVGLPLARTVSTPISLGRAAPPPAQALEHYRSSTFPIVPYVGRIMLPRSIPTSIPKGDDFASNPPGGIDIPGGDVIPVGSGPGFPIPFGGTRALPVAPAAAAPTRQFRTSSMLQGSLMRRVEPVYPPLARNARIQGPVVLAAIISKEGTMENLRLISGHPMLVPAAIEAVRQWRYRPYILNGEAIEVETQITVNFVLAN
jgi:periplasmic protein TonB